MMPKPVSQNKGVPMAKSIRFFMIMLPAFFALVKPVSTMAKPACMKKTRAAPNRTQIVFTAENSIIHSSLRFYFGWECAFMGEYAKRGALPARYLAAAIHLFVYLLSAQKIENAPDV